MQWAAVGVVGPNITVSVLRSLLRTLLHTPGSAPPAVGQSCPVERRPDGRSLSILAFIQHAFTVSGADPVTEHVGLTRTDFNLFFRELTSYGALRPLSPSLPQSQTDTREDCGLMEGTLSLAVQPFCRVVSHIFY